MKRLALFTLLLILPLSAHADEASKRAKIQEMFGLMHIDRLMSQIMDNVAKQASALTTRMSGGQTSPETEAKLDDFRKQLLAKIDTQIGWKTLEPTYIDLYAQTYTEDEIDSILAFYKSPAGTALLAKTPELTAKSTQIVNGRMAQIQPEIVQMLQDFVKANAPAKQATPAPAQK